VNLNCQNRAWLGPAGGGVPERSTVPLVADDTKMFAIASSKIWKTDVTQFAPHVLLSLPVPINRTPSVDENVSATMAQFVSTFANSAD